MSIDRVNPLSATGQHFHADGSSLPRIVDHYDSFFQLGLTEGEKGDLIADLLAPSVPGSGSVTRRTEAFFDLKGGE
jgi:hypothetical protein